MTPEEEAVLNEMLQARRDKRKAAILEHKRRSKFDPIAAKNRADQAAAASGSAMQPPSANRPQPPKAIAIGQRMSPSRDAMSDEAFPVSGTGAEAAAEVPTLRVRPLKVQLSTAKVSSPTPAPPRSSSSASRAVLKPSKPSETEAETEDLIDAEDDDIDEAEFEKAALEFLQEEQRKIRPVAADTDSKTGAQPRGPFRSASGISQQRLPLRQRTVIAPGSFKPGKNNTSSSLSSLKLGPSSVSDASGNQPKNRSSIPIRPVPSALPLVTNEAEEVVTKEDLEGLGVEGLGLEGLEGMTRAQLEALLADEEADQVDGDEGSGEAEELDWDTLAAGESFERYLNEIKAEAAQAKMMRDREDARKKREKDKAGASSAGKGSQMQPSIKTSPGARASGAGTLDVDLGDGDEEQDAEFDQLLKLLEMVGEDDIQGASAIGNTANATASSSGAGQQHVAGSKSSLAARAKKVEEDIDWGVLERMFLGDGWDKEIQELADQVTRSSTGDSEPPGGSEDPGREAGEVPSWRDEVSTLLLGLVGISHQCYLDKPLMDREVTEDERADAFWQAPFALIVQDDSKESMLEYANKKALDMLGIQFDDIYDLSSFDIVASDDQQQQEWLWSVSEAEEKQEKHTTVAEVRIRGSGGRILCARNVLIFRVDNLEGESMGQAILIRDFE